MHVSYDVVHYVPTQVQIDRLPGVFAHYQNEHGLMPVHDSVPFLDAIGVLNITGEKFHQLVGCINRVDLSVRSGVLKGFINENEFTAMVYSAWMLGMGTNDDGERKEAEGETTSLNDETKPLNDVKDDQDRAGSAVATSHKHELDWPR